jgi:hypothetical protein
MVSPQGEDAVFSVRATTVALIRRTPRLDFRMRARETRIVVEE